MGDESGLKFDLSYNMHICELWMPGPSRLKISMFSIYRIKQTFFSCYPYFFPSEADQRSNNEREHENREPSSQHEEESCASDHPM